MSLTTLHTPLLDQSNTLWQSYLEKHRYLAPEALSSPALQDFWAHYDALIQQSKTTKIPQKTTQQHSPKRPQTKPSPSITQVFFSHWKKPFNLHEHFTLYPPVKQANKPTEDRFFIRFFVSMAVVFLLGMLALLLDAPILGFMMVFTSVAAILIKAFAVDTIDTTEKLNIDYFRMGHKIIANRNILFDTTFMTYQFYDGYQNCRVKIHIPYSFITSIRQDTRGIVVIGRTQNTWMDTQSQAGHEVILPYDPQLRGFLSDVAMFNFAQKPRA